MAALQAPTETALTHVSLFSGYEGFGLALRLAGLKIRTVLYVEIEKYCQEIIRQRIRDGFLDNAPIWPDVRSLDGQPFAGKVGILTAGFPCQPHSFAGKRKGAADERNLWPDTARIIGEMGPRYILLENVPGILGNGYAGTVVGQLSEMGYECTWGVVSAAQVGAPHLRWRWWCLAYSSNNRLRPQWRTAQQERQHKALEWGQLIGANGKNGSVADSNGTGLSERNKPELLGQCEAIERSSWWLTEPDVGRVANGVASRVDRLKALGNGIVPAVVREFLRVI